MIDPHRDRHVLVPLLDEENVDRGIQIGATLARSRGTALLVMKVLVVPRTLPLSAHEEWIQADRDVIRKAIRTADTLGVPTQGMVRVGRSTVDIVLGASDEYESEAIVVNTPERSSPRRLIFKGVADRIVANASCDVIVVNADSDQAEVTSLLLPIAGWPYARFATDIACAIATERDSVVDVVHVIRKSASERERERAWDDVSACIDHLSDVNKITIRMPEKRRVAPAIVEQSAEYDLTILGASRTTRLRELIRGSIPRTVSNDAPNTVLMTRQNRKTDSLLRRLRP